MRTRIKKWGNSLALRIPKPFAREVGIEQNSDVEVRIDDGALIVEAIEERRFTLKELMAEVTDDNLHSEVDTGSRVGTEAW